jgi:DNA-binding MarR family transcriptional regulator
LNSERLLRLSDEVGRIASTLARLSSDQQSSSGATYPEGDAPEVSVEAVRAVIRARRLRAQHFAEELFTDPAWDMMLELLQAELSHQRVAVSRLCAAAAVPATTGLRWLKTMVDKGLFIRRADPLDGRRVHVELAPETSRLLRLYFAELASVATI